MLWFTNRFIVTLNSFWNYLCVSLTDRCELDARDQVEDIQMLFIDALQYLLKKRVANESGLHFSKIMNVFLKLREMNEEFLTFYKKMCEDPMIQKYMPELLNFLIDWLQIHITGYLYIVIHAYLCIIWEILILMTYSALKTWILPMKSRNFVVCINFFFTFFLSNLW